MKTWASRAMALVRGLAAAVVVGLVWMVQERLAMANAMDAVMSLNAVYAKAEGDTETQLWSLREAVGWNPDDYHAQYQLGSYYIEQKEAELAQAAYEACLELSPGHLGALLGLADIYTRAGDFGRAMEFVDRARAVAPTSWRVYLSAGTCASGRGDYDEAIELLEIAGRFARVEQIGVYNQLANTYLLSGDSKKALETAAKSLNTKKDNPYAVLIKGKALNSLGRFTEAIVVLENAVARFEKDPVQQCDARLQLAEAFSETGRWLAASEILRDEVRKFGTVPQVREPAAALSQSIALQLSAANSPADQSAAIRCNLGFAYAAMGMLEEAHMQFGEAEAVGVRLEPACSWAHAETLLRLDRPEEAAVRYQASLAKGTAPVQMRLGFAEALTRLRRIEEAKLQYQLVLQSYTLTPEERTQITELAAALDEPEPPAQ